MDARELLFGGLRSGPVAAHAGLAILRVFTGLACALAHGWGKIPPPAPLVGMIEGAGLPAPELLAWLAALAETLGGLLLALGLLTRVGALAILANMAVAAVVIHAGDPFATRELALFYGFVALAFLLIGADRYSLDAVIRDRDARPGGVSRA